MNDETSRSHRWSDATPAMCVRCGVEKYKTGTYCPGSPRERPKLNPKVQAAMALIAALAMGKER